MCRRNATHSVAVASPAQAAPVDACRFGCLQRVGAGISMAVIGRHRAVGDEVPAPFFQRRHEAGVVADVHARCLLEPGQRTPPLRLRRLQVAVRAERRDDPAAPARVGTERAVHRQIRRGVIRRRQHGDAEPLEQRPRPVGVLGEAGRQLVEQPVSRRGGRAFGDLKDLGQLRLEPVAHRGAAKHGPVLAQEPPRLASRRLRQLTLADAEVLEHDPVGVQEARDVVIRGHQQARWIGERRVREQDPGIDVPVRADQRKVTYTLVQPPCDPALAGVGGKQPVGLHPQARLAIPHRRTLSALPR